MDLDTFEQYDILEDKWYQMEQKLPNSAFSMSAVVVQKRYIFSFGQSSYTKKKATQCENIWKLDTWNMAQGWTDYEIKSKLDGVGCQYGFYPLRQNNESCELVVFGGIDNFYPYKVLN